MDDVVLYLYLSYLSKRPMNVPRSKLLVDFNLTYTINEAFSLLNKYGIGENKNKLIPYVRRRSND